VIATEDCIVLKTERGWSEGTRHVFVRNSRTYATYGGLVPGSSEPYVLEGQKVPAGTRLGQIGAKYKMLHFELYDADYDLAGNQRWWTGDSPPRALLNPVNYIQQAAGLTLTRETAPQRHEVLRKLGFYAGPIWAPWGELSEGALRAAQSALGLTPDGQWGPESEARLTAELPTPTRYRKWLLGLGLGLGVVSAGLALRRRSAR